MTVMRMKLGDGTSREVEVDVPGSSDSARLLAADQPGPRVAKRTLDAALDTVVPALTMVVRRLQEVDPAVEEISVDVGLSVGGDTGLLLVRGRAEATFHVTLAWRRPGNDHGPHPAPVPLDSIDDVRAEGGPP